MFHKMLGNHHEIPSGITIKHHFCVGFRSHCSTGWIFLWKPKPQKCASKRRVRAPHSAALPSAGRCSRKPLDRSNHGGPPVGGNVGWFPKNSEGTSPTKISICSKTLWLMDIFGIVKLNVNGYPSSYLWSMIVKSKKDTEFREHPGYC